MSEVLAVTATGILVYIGHKGQVFEVIGGSKGELNLRKLND